MKGLSIPVRAFRGRVALAEGAEKNLQVVALCLADGDSSNPFATDVGLDPPVFTTGGAAVGVVSRRIREHFSRFSREGRMRVENIEAARSKTIEGEVEIKVSYVDLETDEELEAVTKIARG